MMREEFRTRTPFLSEEDHENYEERYEPAYMAATHIDKDVFCEMLKDENVRGMVASVSRAFRLKVQIINELRGERDLFQARLAIANNRVKEMRETLSRISAICDVKLTDVA